MCLNNHTRSLHDLGAFTIALVDDVKSKGTSVQSRMVSGQVRATARQRSVPVTVAGCMGVVRSSTTSCKAPHSYSYPSDACEAFRVDDVVVNIGFTQCDDETCRSGVRRGRVDDEIPLLSKVLLWANPHSYSQQALVLCSYTPHREYCATRQDPLDSVRLVNHAWHDPSHEPPKSLLADSPQSWPLPPPRILPWMSLFAASPAKRNRRETFRTTRKSSLFYFRPALARKLSVSSRAGCRVSHIHLIDVFCARALETLLRPLLDNLPGMPCAACASDSGPDPAW
ncbi:hypothetical protein S7711_11000 [Stachybotrys chartarum IBT 7711]|uniref:Uncharacterized protein n=1 Tax=Stachybotrys chartarum (strain CBS 109288 / IBT 7711) TaxID=1280523 RepID=A0A084B2U1_STACB|nr:hypothetical protein S7711_11000 [Stachybotrys chartarum IBT 7711]KFA81511.1 hypothetical protein S40288_10790 [Stachybotrys chartarum IBT 40288]